MTLQHFQHLTARTPEPELRSAMTLALGIEVPSEVEAYARSYRRVVQHIAHLDAIRHTASRRTKSATASSPRPAAA